ncbi:hypothetical protein CW304_02935 [Bacillus sp. UFRGS-B20]|nr:hypothetical protein CW304_02935 [Bacillus sp. UFRGS-B20]
MLFFFVVKTIGTICLIPSSPSFIIKVPDSSAVPRINSCCREIASVCLSLQRTRVPYYQNYLFVFQIIIACKYYINFFITNSFAKAKLNFRFGTIDFARSSSVKKHCSISPVFFCTYHTSLSTEFFFNKCFHVLSVLVDKNKVLDFSEIYNFMGLQN